MASEVTMKDLQSLQGHCNKQIADVNKTVAALTKDLERVAECEKLDHKNIVDINHRIDPIEKRVAALQASVSVLAAEVKMLTARVA